MPLHGPFECSMIREHGDFMYSGGAYSAADRVQKFAVAVVDYTGGADRWFLNKRLVAP